MMGFIEAIKSFYRNYFNFKGTAGRREFWYPYLYVFIVNAILPILMNRMLASTGRGMAVHGIMFSLIKILEIIMILFTTINFIPTISVTVRRFHDVGKSGAYMLFILIPFIGVVIYFYYLVKDTKYKDNPYRNVVYKMGV